MLSRNSMGNAPFSMSDEAIVRRIFQIIPAKTCIMPGMTGDNTGVPLFGKEGSNAMKNMQNNSQNNNQNNNQKNNQNNSQNKNQNNSQNKNNQNDNY